MLIKSKGVKDFNRYEILIQKGCLSEITRQINEKIAPSRIFVLTNPKVYKLYYDRLKRSFSRQNCKMLPIVIPDGERYKNIETYQKVLRRLVSEKADRKSVLTGLGGGVIGDLAGTVAATYMRGIWLVHIPTTLLAQVDAAIGGKTALDFPQAKNLMGFFYPPRLVFIDPLVLSTLDQQNFLNGLVEVMKLGLVSSKSLWEFIQKNYTKILARDNFYLQKLIVQAVREKVRITTSDPFDRGVRNILNFGHTFGHALETYRHYHNISHGEAISLGILVALKLSVNLKLISIKLFSQVLDLFSEMGLPAKVKGLDLKKIWQIMALDKKAKNREVNFILLKGVAQPTIQAVLEKDFYQAAGVILKK